MLALVNYEDCHLLNWNLSCSFCHFILFYPLVAHSIQRLHLPQHQNDLLYFNTSRNNVWRTTTHQVSGHSELMSLMTSISQTLLGIQTWNCSTHRIIAINLGKRMGAIPKQNTDFEYWVIKVFMLSAVW